MRLVMSIFFAISCVAGPVTGAAAAAVVSVVMGACAMLAGEEAVCDAIVFDDRANGEEREGRELGLRESPAIEVVEVGGGIAWLC
jgi:hypothetical protein